MTFKLDSLLCIYLSKFIDNLIDDETQKFYCQQFVKIEFILWKIYNLKKAIKVNFFLMF